jgi:hypothetical protein
VLKRKEVGHLQADVLRRVDRQHDPVDAVADELAGVVLVTGFGQHQE